MIQSRQLRHQYSAKYKDTSYTTHINVFYLCSFLASGDSYQTLAGRFRRAPCSISVIVSRVCNAIWIELVQKVLPEPKQQDWEEIEKGFRLRWNYPNCCGAVDGKHVAVRQPPNTGSLYFNYKNYFSIVLMAVVDAGYRFIMVDIGNYGSNSDTGIWKHSVIGQRHINDDLGLPQRKLLPGYPEAGLMPHCFVGDEAFGLAPNMMRPFPRQKGLKLPEDQLVFNYRQSRARRIVECVFGILVQRFRVFDRRMYLSDNNAILVTKACVVLHNYLTPSRTDYNVMVERLNPNNEYQYNPQNGALRPLRRMGYHAPQEAEEIRNWFKSYFWTAGAVPWQMDRIGEM